MKKKKKDMKEDGEGGWRQAHIMLSTQHAAEGVAQYFQIKIFQIKKRSDHSDDTDDNW